MGEMLLSERQYIELVAQAVARDIIPEPSSPGAKSLAGMASDALREILKGKDVLPAQMRALAPEGIELARRAPAPASANAAADLGSVCLQQAGVSAGLSWTWAVESPS
jgi:hypothetical protein